LPRIVPSSSRLLVAPDARAAEAWLLAALDELLPPGSPESATSLPVRVLVPSHSLRVDLLARLARRRPAWIGLDVRTLRTFALELLHRHGEAPPRGAALFALELERAARRRRPLVAAFGEFQDGWSTLAAAARDLVDAGFLPELAEPLEELLHAEAAAIPARTLARARALLATLAEALEALEARGLAPEARLWTRAAELVASAPTADAAPQHGSRALFLHGFADATGAVADLLAALARQRETLALLPAPGATSDEAASRFGARLRERFEATAGAPVDLPAAADADLAELVAAVPELEARATVAAVAAELARGVAAERIGIVLREPGRYRSPFQRQLERQGVPYSGSTAVGPTAPGSHAATALLGALEAPDETPIEIALELVGDGDRALAASLALAFGALGIHRLGGLGALGPGSLDRWREHGFPLPVRAGIETVDPEDGESEAASSSRLVRRQLPVERLEQATHALRQLADGLAAVPARAPWAHYPPALRGLAERLGDRAAEAAARLLDAVTRLVEEVPADYPLDRRGLLDLLREPFAAESRAPVGGRGGGVQLLSLVEARGRSFDLLFVPGLVRGHFPRPIAAEPVLPDGLRRRLRELLPDLPVKAEGHDEERFLFTQLLGAAPRVVLSRSLADEDGKPLAASPLLEALRRGGGLADFRAPEPELALLDRAVAAGLEGGAKALRTLLPAALDEGRRRFAAESTREDGAGAARWRILVEYDADPADPAGRERARAPGPWSGLTGAGSWPAPATATTFEALGRCAWQAFLERALRLAPLPDPLAALPALDRRWIGSVVHEVLARLQGGAVETAADFASALDAPGAPLAWPGEATLERLLREAVAATLADVGSAAGPLAALVAGEARQLLAVARRLDAEDGARWLAAELAGEASVAGETIPFRVDRVSRLGDALVFTDFKIGAPGAGLDRRKAETRQKHLLAGVRTGTRLQGALYLAAAAPRPSVARYTFLRPDLDDELRHAELAAGEEAAAALAGSVAILATARRLGLHAPRLLEPGLDSEYAGCDRCEVAEACVRGDSGFRLRLERWHAAEQNRTDRDEVDEALWQLWRLPTRDRERA
jgi:hypothetical protein